MAENAETLDPKLSRRSSNSRRTSRLSSIASGISRRLSTVSGSTVTTDNPLFANKDDLFAEQHELHSCFLNTQGINYAGVLTGCNPPDALKLPSRHGVRFSVLQRIRDQLRQIPNKDGQVWSCTNVYKLFKTFTASQQCSFTTLLQQYDADTQHPFAGGNTNDVSDAAHVYVAQAWEMPFNVLVESLECFMENNNKNHNTTYFYVSGFSLNLHAELDKEEYMNGLWTCIGGCQDVVFVVDRWLNPVSFTLLWCLWELVAGIESETTQVTLQLSKNESESFRAELSNDIEVIWDNFFSLNAETAMTSSEDDSKLINDYVKESISKEKIGMNQRIMKLLRGWLVDVCKAELEASRMQDAQGDRTVRLMNNLGVLLLRESKLKEAEALYREGLQMREDTLDANHPDIATSCNLLGTITYNLAKYKESEHLLRHALAIRENPSSGCSELDIAQSCNDLGELLTTLAKFDEAEGLLQRSLDIRETKLGDKHIIVAQSCNSIGILLEWRHKHEESKEMHHRALTICEELLYPNHLEIAESCSRIAVTLLNMRLGKPAEQLDKEAKALLSRALQIFEQLLDENHFLIGICVRRMGTVFKVQRNLVDAEVWYKRALDIQLKTLGENHLIVGNLYSSISEICGDDRLDEQFDWSTRALQVYKVVYGDYHSNIATALYQLAGIYALWGQLQDFVDYYREAVRVYIEYSGEYNEKSLEMLSDLASFFLQYPRARWKDALEVYSQVIRISLKINGVNHETTIEYLHPLVQIAAKRVSCQQAEPYARLLVKASTGLNGEVHLDTVKYYATLADVLEKQEKFEEARSIYQKIVECKQELNESVHNYQLKVVEMLIKNEQWKDAENMIRVWLPSIPTSSTHRFTRTMGHYFLGIALERQNNLAEAVQSYNKAFKICRTRTAGERDIRAQAHLGYCRGLARLGKLRAAYNRCMETQFTDISPGTSVRVANMKSWLAEIQGNASDGVDDS